jgi:hypothetical protein
LITNRVGGSVILGGSSTNYNAHTCRVGKIVSRPIGSPFNRKNKVNYGHKVKASKSWVAILQHIVQKG